MTGSGILLDTNALIYFLEGRRSIADLVVLAGTVFYSPISEIEVLAAPHLSAEEVATIRSFLSSCSRVELDQTVTDLTIDLRRRLRLKVPDAIIAASAMSRGVPLATADKDFAKVDGLEIVDDFLT